MGSGGLYHYAVKNPARSSIWEREVLTCPAASSHGPALCRPTTRPCEWRQAPSWPGTNRRGLVPKAYRLLSSPKATSALRYVYLGLILARHHALPRVDT